MDDVPAGELQAALSELLRTDQRTGIGVVLDVLAGEPRIKPSRGLLVDPGDAVWERWSRRVAAGAAIVASPALAVVFDEILDELAESPELAAAVFATVEPFAGLDTGHRTALLALRPPPRVALRPWTSDDLPLLEALNTPVMTEHLGGPETEEDVRRRLERYVAPCRNGGQQYVITADGTPAGSIGYWPGVWHYADIWETGWAILPRHQGRGVARSAAAAVIERARADPDDRDALHAFPSPDNVASNALCAGLGFELQGGTDFEYPAGRWMRVNDWRLPLR